MELASLMAAVLDFMKTPITVFGFTFSFFEVMLTVCLGSVVFWFIGKALS